MYSYPPLPAWIAELPNIQVERKHNRWVAVRISQIPEAQRDPWGTDSDQLIAVCTDFHQVWTTVGLSERV